MYRTLLPWILVLLLSAGAAPAVAQVIEGQPRPTEGRFAPRRTIDPNRTSQALTITVNLTGGYDENLMPLDPSLGVETFNPRQEGFSGAGAATMSYRRGNAARSIDSFASAYINRGDMTIDQPVGGTIGLNGMSELGRRMGVQGGLSSSYEPTSIFDAFDGLSDQVVGGTVPDVRPTQAITTQRWLSMEGNASIYRNWTSRQRMEFQYAATRRQNISANHIASAGRQQTLSLQHSWNPRQNAGLQFAYRVSEHRQNLLEAGLVPLRSQTGDVRLRLDRRVSSMRLLSFTFGGGATQTESQSVFDITPRHIVEPSVFGSVRLDLSRRWSASADARQDITVLDGLTPQPFTTTAVAARLEGVLGGTQLTVSWASSRGDSLSAPTGAFATSTATLQAQRPVSRTLAVFGTLTHYQHYLQDIPFLQTGLPSRYNRDSLRVGVTLWVPVLGGS